MWRRRRQGRRRLAGTWLYHVNHVRAAREDLLRIAGSGFSCSLPGLLLKFLGTRSQPSSTADGVNVEGHSRLWLSFLLSNERECESQIWLVRTMENLLPWHLLPLAIMGNEN